MKPFTSHYIRYPDSGNNNHWEYHIDGVFTSLAFDRSLLVACDVPDDIIDDLIELNDTMGTASYHAAAEDGSWRLGGPSENKMREIAAIIRKLYGQEVEPILKSINATQLVSI